mmetsp:Transcript_18908/g.56694  ORF Transcript_18908/g.56694 Transcript_18908/m.56694 type:complete len:352 (+) Transcript_18908:1466-2521(+)
MVACMSSRSVESEACLWLEDSRSSRRRAAPSSSCERSSPTDKSTPAFQTRWRCRRSPRTGRSLEEASRPQDCSWACTASIMASASRLTSESPPRSRAASCRSTSARPWMRDAFSVSCAWACVRLSSAASRSETNLSCASRRAASRSLSCRRLICSIRSSSPSRCEVRVAISVVWERICSRSLLLPSFTVPSMSTSPSLASACVSISWLRRSHWRWRSRTDFRSASWLPVGREGSSAPTAACTPASPAMLFTWLSISATRSRARLAQAVSSRAVMPAGRSSTPLRRCCENSTAPRRRPSTFRVASRSATSWARRSCRWSMESPPMLAAPRSGGSLGPGASVAAAAAARGANS